MKKAVNKNYDYVYPPKRRMGRPTNAEVEEAREDLRRHSRLLRESLTKPDCMEFERQGELMWEKFGVDLSPGDEVKVS